MQENNLEGEKKRNMGTKIVKGQQEEEHKKVQNIRFAYQYLD